LQVVFYWRASQPFTYDWTISARLMAAGQIVSVGDQPAQDDHPPVWGAYPTTRWRVGEIVRDDHLVPWQEGLEYDRVGAVVYRPTGDGLQNLGAVEFTPVFGGSFEYGSKLVDTFVTEGPKRATSVGVSRQLRPDVNISP